MLVKNTQKTQLKKQKKEKLDEPLTFRYSCNFKKCADRLHVEFWEISYGKLTEEEFKIFCESETLSQEINKAYIELKLMRK